MNPVLLLDLSRTLLFPRDKNYSGSLNQLYKNVKTESNFDFFNYFLLNHSFFSYLKTLNKTPLYLFSSDIIQNDQALKGSLSIFTQIFSALELGTDKQSSESYKKIAEILNKNPAEVIFIDDSLANIEAARSGGVQTILYNKTSQTIHDLTKLLNQ